MKHAKFAGNQYAMPYKLVWIDPIAAIDEYKGIFMSQVSTYAYVVPSTILRSLQECGPAPWYRGREW